MHRVLLESNQSQYLKQYVELNSQKQYKQQKRLFKMDIQTKLCVPQSI